MKNKYLMIRISEIEKDRLQKAAKRNMKSMSEYVRDILLKEEARNEYVDRG